VSPDEMSPFFFYYLRYIVITSRICSGVCLPVFLSVCDRDYEIVLKQLPRNLLRLLWTAVM